MRGTPEHGTLHAYAHFGCRCQPCHAAWATYNRAQRAAKKARGQCSACRRPVKPGSCRCETHYAAQQAATRRWYERKQALAGKTPRPFGTRVRVRPPLAGVWDDVVGVEQVTA